MNNFPNLIQSMIYTNKIQIQLSLIAQPKIFQIHVLSVAKSRMGAIGWGQKDHKDEHYRAWPQGEKLYRKTLGRKYIIVCAWVEQKTHSSSVNSLTLCPLKSSLLCLWSLATENGHLKSLVRETSVDKWLFVLLINCFTIIFYKSRFSVCKTLTSSCYFCFQNIGFFYCFRRSILKGGFVPSFL